MYCVNCGQELAEGASVCPGCGMVAATWQGDLPEGIYRDKEGLMQWEYELNMWKNPVHLYMLVKTAFIADAFVMAIFCMIVGLSADMGLEDILSACAYICGGSLVLCLLGTLVVNIFLGGRIYQEFIMGEDGFMTVTSRKTYKRLGRFMQTGAVAGTLAWDANMVRASMDGRCNTFAVKFSELKKINEHRKNDCIEVYGDLSNYNQIYAYPHQYDFVLGYIKAHCRNLL